MKPIIHIEWGHVPFLKAILAYGSGIVCGYCLDWSADLLFTINWLLIFFLFITIIFCMVRKMEMSLFTLFFYIFLLLFGVWKFGQFAPKSKQNFLSDPSTYHQLIGIVSDEPVLKEKTIRFPLRLEAGLDSSGSMSPISGKVMVTMRRDSTLLSTPQYGDKLQFLNAIRKIPPPYNPHEFDYKKYLHLKGIYYQTYLNKENFVVLGRETTWLSPVLKARQYFVDIFRRYIHNDLSFRIASALVFGYRSELDQDVLSAFSNTGTIHVLSVSGMHVSMFFILLTFLLRPLNRIHYGRNIRFGLVLVIIWLYVVLTGMAPPILRAGIMITFFIFATWMERSQISLNTLLASAFFILLFAPEMLFDIGFQLSYLAMLGIFLIYPLLTNWYVPQNKIWRPIVEYSYISIAAQLLTAPLAMYYFGQFPNYFLLANLIIALPATVIMYAGIGLMVCHFDFFGKILGTIEHISVQFMFDMLKYIDRFPYATFQGITFQAWQVLTMFLFIGTLFHAFNHRSKKGLYLMAFFGFILMVSIYTNFYSSHQYQGIKVYNLRQHLAIAQIKDGKARLYSNVDSPSHSAINYSILPDLKKYCRPEHISFVQLPDTVNFQLRLGDVSILVWNNGHIPAKQSDIMIVRKNRWLKNSYQRKDRMYILDGSNTWHNLRKNQDLLESENGDYYILKDNFAYVWEDK